jgi:hypothetical protein
MIGKGFHYLWGSYLQHVQSAKPMFVVLFMTDRKPFGEVRLYILS